MTEKLPDLASMSEASLRQLIANYERLGRGSAEVPMAARLELHNKVGPDFSFQKVMLVIVQAAKEKHFIAYGDLAKACGLDWSKAYRQIGPMLGNVVEYGYHKGWPMLSAIVVNAEHVDSGSMEASALQGFIAAATNLKLFTGGDERKFLREQQDAVFAWATSQS